MLDLLGSFLSYLKETKVLHPENLCRRHPNLQGC